MMVRSNKCSYGNSTMRTIKNLVFDLLIGVLGGIAIVSLIIGASVQYQGRINEIAVMEAGE